MHAGRIHEDLSCIPSTHVEANMAEHTCNLKLDVLSQRTGEPGQLKQ